MPKTAKLEASSRLRRRLSVRRAWPEIGAEDLPCAQSGACPREKLPWLRDRFGSERFVRVRSHHGRSRDPGRRAQSGLMPRAFGNSGEMAMGI